jgi:hypothetical protein
MTKTRAIDLRVVVVLVAGLLAGAALWAGTSWAGGSGGQSPPGATPAQTGDGGSSFTQSGGSGDDRRDCPEKDPGGQGPSTSEDSAETAV